MRFASRKTCFLIDNLCSAVTQIERHLWRTEAEKADLKMTVKTSSRITSTLTRTTSILTPILDGRIAHLEKTVTVLQGERDGINLTMQSRQCETLCAQGRILDAARILIKITNSLGRSAAANEFIVAWITGKFQRCEPEKDLNSIARVYSSLYIDPGNNGRQGIGRREF